MTRSMLLAFFLAALPSSVFGATGRWVNYNYEKSYYVISERGQGVLFKNSQNGEVIIHLTGPSTFWYGDRPPHGWIAGGGQFAIVCAPKPDAPCEIYSTEIKKRVWKVPGFYRFGDYSVFWQRINNVEKTVRLVVRSFEGKLIEDITYDCYRGQCDLERSGPRIQDLKN